MNNQDVDLTSPMDNPYVKEVASQNPVGWYQLGPLYEGKPVHVFCIGYLQHRITKEVKAALWTPLGVGQTAFIDLTPVPTKAVDAELKARFREWFKESV